MIEPKNLDRITKAMEAVGLQGNPRKHLVLWGWRYFADCYKVYECNEPPISRPVKAGGIVWVPGDSADLVAVDVVEDRGDLGLWVRSTERDVEFLVPIDDVHTIALPYKPVVIHRRDLYKYIGRHAAEKWAEARRSENRGEVAP